MYLHTILSGLLHIMKTTPHIMRKVLYIIFNLHIRQSRRSIGFGLVTIIKSCISVHESLVVARPGSKIMRLFYT